MICINRNPIYELSHELPNDVRHTILEINKFSKISKVKGKVAGNQDQRNLDISGEREASLWVLILVLLLTHVEFRK